MYNYWPNQLNTKIYYYTNDEDRIETYIRKDGFNEFATGVFSTDGQTS